VTRPRWERPALIALLVATAALYLWGLGASGWANAYYSAAAQAGSSSWKAFFYASTDSASAITIDKPPLALWLMSLSVKVFGLSSWSILVPEALCGVASVGVLYATVRRWFRAEAALLAGAAMALTPVSALMFRFNNPDALLVLLLTGAAYALVRAVETASTRWAVLVGVLVGLGFMTKMLQALLVVPAFALVYLVAAPTGWWRRVRQLLATGAALAVSSLAWVAIVMAVPAADRPYIGGSQDNSLWNLILGYNGVGRLTGNESGSVGGGPAGSSGRWGATGLLRMFGERFGGQISWLLPAALLVLVAGLVWTAKRPRTDRTRAALLMWGGWLVVTGVAFSLGEGIIHEYYSVALAPPIAALVGAGAVELWHRRAHWAPRGLLAVAVLGTTGWATVLLDRTEGWMPWVRTGVEIAGLGAALGLVVPAVHLPLGLRRAVAGAALAAGLGGPLAFTMSTVAAAHDGSLPLAGPTVRGVGGGLGPLFRGFGVPGGTGPAGGQLQRSIGGPPTAAPSARAAAGPAGSPGGLLDASEPSAGLTELLVQDADDYTWVAATVGANSAAGYQLAAREPVMAIGGFNGTDPSPTLEQFQQYVADGRIHWFLGSGGVGRFGAGGRTGSTSSQIASWVRTHFESRTVGGLTVYDLTSPTAAI
jgi:4-amino-4-deoxy-L-arabinose transferase-like glycosyltransferase